MAITAQDIHNASFTIDRKGYDVDEVDVFLEHVADEIDELNKLVADLQSQLDGGEMPVSRDEGDTDAALSEVQAAHEAEIAELEAEIADLQEQLAEKSANDSAISQALIVAQRSADDIVAQAKAEASSIVKDADDQADRIVEKAEVDRQKIIEAIRKLESDREDVRVEYRDMLTNFMSDAQRKLADIDGDARRAQVSYQARSEAHASSYAPAQPRYSAPMTATTVGAAAAPAAAQPAATASVAPVDASYVEKDFSGFGAADADFEFDDID